MASNDFTPREQQLMAYAWQCFEGEPKVNFSRLAELAGMTNPVSASNAWARIKKKLVAQAGNGGESPVKKTPNKRKKKGEEAGGDDEESPTKKVKATPNANGGRKKGKEDEEGEGDEGHEINVKGEEGDDDEDIFL